ncbi:MAG: polysaccharide deacetylase family protein [Oligoflexia bacterium]|nr:polysaccharide deacetylase family protein [Oligoflexia bacterium]
MKKKLGLRLASFSLTGLLMGGLVALSPFAKATPEARRPEPNELGKIMVLMYHQIREPEAEWSRTPQAFLQDLELLAKKGYTLVNLADVVDGRIDVPAGRTPVVLTFDDAARGQFSKADGKWSPDSAVGMIQAVHERHPEFGIAGSFYLNPDRKRSTAWSGMLREMVEMGFELGNHTVNHPQLKKLSQEQVEHEIAGLQGWLSLNVPGYVIRTMAMPFGIYPKVDTWAEKGESRGIRYHNAGLLEVGSGPSPSPFSKKFRPLHIPRIRGSDPYFQQALKYFDEHPEQRFVSDGDPQTVSVPARLRQELREELPSGVRVDILR